MATRYALMNFAEAGAAFTMLFCKIERYVSADRLVLLVILFNAVAIGGRALVSLFADRVGNRHMGVLLGVMLFSLGFFWPVDFGIDFKVGVAAVGSAIFHAFSTSSVMAKSGFKASGIGALAAGAALGAAVSNYKHFLGYIFLVIFILAACASDKSEAIPDACEDRKTKAPKTAFAPILVLLLLGALGAVSHQMASLALPWDVNRKTILLLALALTAGRFLGGLISDLIGALPTLAVSLAGGSLLLMLKGDKTLFVLAGVALLSVAVAPLLTLLFRLMPCHPGFSVSLATGVGYMGYVLAKLVPAKSSYLILIGGGTLLVAAAADILLTVLGKRAEKAEPKKEVADRV
jgi:hypothetical protein